MAPIPGTGTAPHKVIWDIKERTGLIAART